MRCHDIKMYTTQDVKWCSVCLSKERDTKSSVVTNTLPYERFSVRDVTELDASV